MLEGRYLVTGVLAHGGMSTVYRGMDTRLERPVAIKVLHQQFAADSSWSARFEREARAAAKLHHPHVVAVHDQGVDYSGDSPHAFLVMELVEGGTLRTLIAEHGRLTPAMAVEIGEQLLEALAAAHKAGLIHRDVKPENVLIGRGAVQDEAAPATVKVADFGLVRAIAGASSTSSSVILGTVAYLSPEQVETGEATERSDVYSAGLLLYEMLTGKPAFSGDTALSVAYQHVNSDVPEPRAANPDVPIALNKLVVRATRRDPGKRPADAAAFLADLRKVRDSLRIKPTDVPMVTAPDRGHAPTAVLPAVGAPGDAAPGHAATAMYEAEPEPRRPRRRIALWAFAVLLLGGLVAAGVWLFGEAAKVTVPKVAGMTKGTAERLLTDKAELEVRIERTRHNTVPQDRTITTDPAAGTVVERGDEITLFVSLGRPVVPDIKPGTSRADAVAAIEKQQLKALHDRSADIYHVSVKEGRVLSVSPKAGTKLKIGEVVRYGVSKGTPPEPVPDVRGLSKDDAFAQLTAAGFEPFDAGEEFDADVERGHVTRTDPAEGTTVSDSLKVGVYTSNAIDVPNVIGRSVGDAKRIISEAGLTPDVRGNRNFGFVIRQNPSSGRLEPGGTVRLSAFGFF